MARPRFGWVAAAGCALATAVGAPAEAQVKASEHASMSQTIDGTVITMEYHRPSLRGRGSLFGGQVHWGEVWTPGANWATILDVSKDVELDGHPVPAGRYSVWMVVNPDAWEFVLEPDDSLYHIPPPELTDEQIRFMVTPGETEHSLETLAWYFPAVRWNGGDLRMHWGETVIEMDVTVESTYQLTMPAEEAAPYLGSYRYTFGPGVGAEPTDTMEMEILFEGDRMVTPVETMPEEGEVGPEYQQLFIPRGEGFFISGYVVDGEVWEIVDEGVFEFFPTDGGGMEFEMRGPGDQLWMRGWRVEGRP